MIVKTQQSRPAVGLEVLCKASLEKQKPTVCRLACPSFLTALADSMGSISSSVRIQDPGRRKEPLNHAAPPDQLSMN